MSKKRDDQAEIYVFSEFLRKNDKTLISNFITKKLLPLSYEDLIDGKKNFFQALKGAIADYLGKHSFDEIKSLLEIFHKFENAGIVKVELQILSELINENKSLITENITLKDGMHSVLIECFDGITDYTDDVGIAYNSTLNLLGETAN